MLHTIFLRHPHSVGESYMQHLIAALGFAAQLMVASIACLVHALVPALFQRTASQIVRELHAKMVSDRRRHAPTAGVLDYAI